MTLRSTLISLAAVVALLTDARPTTLRAHLIEAPQLIAAALRRLA